MNKKILLCILSLMFTQAGASAWDGFYMGTNLGATVSNYSDIKLYGRGSIGSTIYPAASNKFSNQKVTQGNAKINLGVGHTYGIFYVGGNLFLQLGVNTDKDFTAKNSSGNNTTTVKQEIVPSAFSFGIDVQPGITVSKNLLIYTELGFIFQPIDLHTYTTLSSSPTSYFGDVDKSFTAKGLQYGLGVRYRINDRMSIDGSFVITSYNNSDQALGSTTSPIISGNNIFYVYSSTKLKSAQTFLVGVDYKF